MVVAVGGLYLSPVPDALVRVACPFGGGICQREELCGALSGGIMVLGALWGRNAANVNDDFVRTLACKYRERFLAIFGETQCRPIRESGWHSEESGCAQVVRASAELLIDLIETGHRHTPFTHEVQR